MCVSARAKCISFCIHLKKSAWEFSSLRSVDTGLAINVIELGGREACVGATEST